MQAYIIRRLLLAIFVLWGVTLLVFSIMRLVPGDVVMMRLGEMGTIAPEQLAKLRADLGLDKPFHEQYITWISGVVRGDLGDSLWTGTSVRNELAKRIPVSAELAAMAIVLALSIAIPVGVISAIRQDTVLDYVGRLLAISGLSLPDFWLGTVMVMTLSLWFRWLPPIGYVPFFTDPLANLQQFAFPALILGFRLSATSMRMTRSTMLEVLRQDYIRTAWSKGLKERAVIYRHALKNAMIPVITIIGTQFSVLLGGTVIMETIFVLPGVGRLTLDSIFNRDYTQLQGNVLFLAGIMVTANLLVDLSYAWFDPRIRYQ